eukprot:7045782-Pyramimonas_sp.AAC.1
MAAKKPVLVKPEDIPDVSQYEDLVSKYKGLKWRIISRPGGATMKPTDYYRLEGKTSTLPWSDGVTGQRFYTTCTSLHVMKLNEDSDIPINRRSSDIISCVRLGSTTAAVKQVEKGDNTEEKPMWAPRGGLDFDGREAWDNYEAIKVGAYGCTSVVHHRWYTVPLPFIYKTRHSVHYVTLLARAKARYVSRGM